MASQCDICQHHCETRRRRGFRSCFTHSFRYGFRPDQSYALAIRFNREHFALLTLSLAFYLKPKKP